MNAPSSAASIRYSGQWARSAAGAVFGGALVTVVTMRLVARFGVACIVFCAARFMEPGHVIPRRHKRDNTKKAQDIVPACQSSRHRNVVPRIAHLRSLAFFSISQ